MTSHSPQNPYQHYPSAPPPPDPAPTKHPKRKRGLLIGGISAGVVLVLGGGGFVLAVTTNQEKLEEFETAHSKLSDSYDKAVTLVDEAPPLEPTKREELEGHIALAEGVLNAEAPGVFSFDIDDRTAELVDSRQPLIVPMLDLEDAIEHRDEYASLASDGEELLAEGQELLETTADKVADSDAYDELSSYVSALQEALDEEPDNTSSEAFANGISTISDASDNVNSNLSTVSTSHDEWVKAEEEAAKTDPDNYEALSERDWQLVERNPDSHTGDKYVLYGEVTQADAAIGIIDIRVNTGAVQQSRGYEYDVNTMVQSGSTGIFDEVVQGDHVKMLVEVDGSRTYSTMIGGSATAVEVTAYDIEVLGQL